MKTQLVPLLICPACLPKERPLRLSAEHEADGEVLRGTLACPHCRRRFPIRDGIALLLADPDHHQSGAQWRYEEQGMTSRYLWTHYRDLLGATAPGSPPNVWADCLPTQAAACLDAGCSVGRLTFEMANRSELAVGCDLSRSFIATARRLARERRLSFSLPLEGQLMEPFELRLPDDWRCDRLEFVVADALRLPFAAGSFPQVASLNLLDRVNYPLAHLFEMNRVATPRQAGFLVADPFSWSATVTPEERWLGGTSHGPWAGRGIDNLRALLEGKKQIIKPPWRIEQEGIVDWTIRNHCSHHELISSYYLVASR